MRMRAPLFGVRPETEVGAVCSTQPFQTEKPHKIQSIGGWFFPVANRIRTNGYVKEWAKEATTERAIIRLSCIYRWKGKKAH